jgi:hypothetical protein
MKAKDASNEIDHDAMTTTLMTRQLFYFICCIARSGNSNEEGEGRTKQLPRNNQTFMLLCAGCNNGHIAPCGDQWRKYTEVEYDKYTKDGVYIAKGMYITKDKYIEYAKNSVYTAKGEYGKYTKEATSVKEGHNKPLAKEGHDESLAKDGGWAGCNNEPLATRAGHVRCARQQ